MLVLGYFHTAGKATVDFQGWEKINEAEVIRGEKKGKPREKIVNVEEMIAIANS